MNDRELHMVRLWNSGNDTVEIARAMGIPESHVYNALPRLRTLWHEVHVKATLSR